MANTKKDIVKGAVAGVSMKDAGKPVKELSEVVSSAPKRIYPSMYLEAAQAPFLKGYDVGSECTFLVKGKVISRHASNNRDEYCVEIRKIGSAK